MGFCTSPGGTPREGDREIDIDDLVFLQSYYPHMATAAAAWRDTAQ
jgi:hypothetical protein